MFKLCVLRYVYLKEMNSEIQIDGWLFVTCSGILIKELQYMQCVSGAYAANQLKNFVIGRYIRDKDLCQKEHQKPGLKEDISL